MGSSLVILLPTSLTVLRPWGSVSTVTRPLKFVLTKEFPSSRKKEPLDKGIQFCCLLSCCGGGGGGGGGGASATPTGAPTTTQAPQREQAEQAPMVFNINFGGAVIYDTQRAAEQALADRITTLQNVNRRGAPRRRP